MKHLIKPHIVFTEERAPEPPVWKVIMQGTVAICFAVSVVLAVDYATLLVPDSFPRVAIPIAASIGLTAVLYLFLWLLWLSERLSEPFVTLWERLPALPSLTKREFILVVTVVALAVSVPVIASQWRPRELSALQRAVASRPALPVQAPAVPRLSAVAVLPPEPKSVRPLLETLRRPKAEKTPIQHRKSKRR